MCLMVGFSLTFQLFAYLVRTIYTTLLFTGRPQAISSSLHPIQYLSIREHY